MSVIQVEDHGFGSRVKHLMTESRRMSFRRSVTLSAGGLEALLLASEVAEQVMANLKSMGSGSKEAAQDSSAEKAKEVGGDTKNENENEGKNESEGKNEASAVAIAQGGGGSGGEKRPTKRHMRSLSDSGVVVVLQMADGNQRARDRRRAQWEKKKAMDEQKKVEEANKSEEDRLAEQRRKEQERIERERKEREMLAAKNARLLELFVPCEGSTSQPTSPRSEPKQERLRRPEGDDIQNERGSDKETPRSGSDESAEDSDRGVEEWERQDVSDEQNWGSREEKEKRGKLKQRLNKIKPTKIIGGMKKAKESKRARSSSKREEATKPVNDDKGRHSPLLHSSPV